MAPLKLGKPKGDGGAPQAAKKERRGGKERRSSKERRRDGSRLGIRDLYQSDLDRHLWSWASPSARKAKARRRRRRQLAGVLASAAGALSAAGLSYFMWRKFKRAGERDDPEAAEGKE